MLIPFNKPFMTGNEIDFITKAYLNLKLAGDGEFSFKCSDWINEKMGRGVSFLTHSCTAALEMTSLLLEINRGDEVIMPSYTFVSTANAFTLRGATPVFIDIRGDTLNIDERQIESAITSKTRAIVVVHYAGISCEMDAILKIGRKYNLPVIEDAAQGFLSTYKGNQLGSLGDFGAFSFHETKNIISGEGGALVVNSRDYVRKAEIIREKGTDRSQYFRGEIDKYTWQSVGSSYLPGELIAAFLWAQLQSAVNIINTRKESWSYYHERLESFELNGKLKRPTLPLECDHNGHMYYVVLHESCNREKLLEDLKTSGINAVFHYVPLHSSPAGLRYGRALGNMNVTNTVSESLIRLPLWMGITKKQQDIVIEKLKLLL